ncbi:MAG: hypothetical protein ACM3KE_20975 [Hyphomicrobiales bacterium]
MTASSPHRQTNQLCPACIFLVSGCVMVMEIAVSRLLSALFSYHYVFLVLSLALSGLGIGGMLSWFFRNDIPDDENSLSGLGWPALVFALAVPASILLAIQAGRIADSLWAIVLIGPILCTPFAAAGWFIAEMYRSFPAISHRLYGMDLLGAGAGAWAAVGMLDRLGGIRVHFIVAASAALVAFVIGVRQATQSKRLTALSLCALITCLVLGAGLFPGGLLQIPVGRNPEKEIHDALGSFQGELVESRWTAFGRTDLVAYRSRPEVMDLYVDGTAGSPMFRFSGRHEDLAQLVEGELADFPGRFPFRFLKPDARNSALVIGPGGGRDILLALWGGFKNITAVEINADLVEMARERSRFNGGIYAGYPDVAIVIDEGRRYVRSRVESYDLIFLSLPVTNTSRSLEGFALTENYLFTLESMAEYWEQLTAQGSLAVVGHNDAEILRLLVLALTMMERRGFSPADAMKHIYVVSSGDYLCLVLRRAAFTPAESREMHRAMLAQGLQPGSSYFPFVPGVNPSLLALSLGRIGLNDLIGQVQARGWDIQPVTDNRPFFYKLETGVPAPVLVTGGVALALFAIVIGLPWALGIRRRLRRDAPLRFKRPLGVPPAQAIGLFSLLGIGFMCMELPLLARFTLLFGSPSVAMAVFLSTLLAWAGLGSWISRSWRPKAPQRRIRAACLAIAPILLVYAALLPWILSKAAQLDQLWRLIACAGLLMPVGLVAGVPFPSAVQWLKHAGMENHIPWMYAINGVSSVAGSTMTLLIAIGFGFQQALLAGAGCYLLVYVLVRSASELELNQMGITIGTALLS